MGAATSWASRASLRPAVLGGSPDLSHPSRPENERKSGPNHLSRMGELLSSVRKLRIFTPRAWGGPRGGPGGGPAREGSQGGRGGIGGFGPLDVRFQRGKSRKRPKWQFPRGSREISISGRGAARDGPGARGAGGARGRPGPGGDPDPDPGGVSPGDPLGPVRGWGGGLGQGGLASGGSESRRTECRRSPTE